MLRLRSSSRTVGRMTVALLLIAIPAAVSWAGDFQIAPMSLELRKGLMSGTIAVTNEAKEKLSLQLSAKAWEQDRDGQDRYAETTDVVFYPKILTIEPGEERVIRLGLRGAPGPRERTYRLLLEEISVRREGEPRKKTGVAIVMRISLPVFLAPVRIDERGTIGMITMTKGTVTVPVANDGNIHFKLRTVTARGMAADGSVLFQQELPGWYLLPGALRAYRFEIPPADCTKLARIEVHAAGETLSINGMLNVSKEMCTP